MSIIMVGKARNHLAVFASGCIACGSLDAGSVELGPVHAVSTTSAPIIGGENSPSSDNAIVQIGMVADGEVLRMTGSGTLVAPNLVMTARHNIAPILQMEEWIDCRAGKTQVLFGPSVLDERRVFVGPENHSYTLSAAGARRIKRAVVGPSPVLCNSDLAFLILEQPIHDIEPLSLRLSRPPSVLEMVSVVGFGFAATNGAPAKVRQRLDGLRVTVYTPNDGVQTLMGEGLGRILMDVRDRAPCVGDSGGPVLSADRAAIGVISLYFTTDVGEVDPLNYFRNCLNSTWVAEALYDRRELALEAFAEAGYPYIEDDSKADTVPIGTSCEDNSDCASKLCAVIGRDRVCVSDCTDAPCPDGFSCTSASNAMLCLKQYDPPPSESGCSLSRSNSPGPGSHFAIALLAGLACMRRRGKAWYRPARQVSRFRRWMGSDREG